jgi:DNA polymerase III subunit beta
MRFTVSREVLIKPLQLVAGVVERRHTLPVLANVLIQLKEGELLLVGSDSEVEIMGRIALSDGFLEAGEITVPAKKFLDICKSLPDGSTLDFVYDKQKVLVKSGRSKFTLSTLPASDFPLVQQAADDLTFQCSQKEVRRLIERTSFAMAQQDVRYYLNGMLWELRSDSLRAVATDGHRLAMCTRPLEADIVGVRQAILPRKAVIELSRLLGDPEDTVEIALGANNIRASTASFTFTSKLVDGKFPDYERVLPMGGDKVVLGNRDDFKQAFVRTAILSNDKYRGVRFVIENGVLTVTANNPEQEEAEEQVFVEYEGEPLEVGFNVSYLLDVTQVIDSDAMSITMADNNSSALIKDPSNNDSIYVVMPMRL